MASQLLKSLLTHIASGFDIWVRIRNLDYQIDCWHYEKGFISGKEILDLHISYPNRDYKIQSLASKHYEFNPIQNLNAFFNIHQSINPELQIIGEEYEGYASIYKVFGFIIEDKKLWLEIKEASVCYIDSTLLQLLKISKGSIKDRVNG